MSKALTAALAGIGLAVLTKQGCSAQTSLDWQKLPSLPDPIGFAGTFAGTSGGALIVAGGANFPAGMPWDGGHKAWYDTAFVLERTNGVWRGGFKLPRTLGAGVSVTTRDGVICIGGSDGKQHFREVFRLVWANNELKSEPLPPLPGPLANSCGAVVGETIYVAGGIATPEATQAMKNFWAFDLRERGAKWRELPPWPGPARMLSVAASVGGAFYLAGGADLAPDGHSQAVRTYLKDTYRFTPGSGWRHVAEMPNPVVAAPTPAPVVGRDCFLVIGGDDGSLVNFEPKPKHPGFPKRVLSYDTQADRWSAIGESPAPRAVVPTTVWNGLYVMPAGEMRPGVRSPEVWAACRK